MADTGGEGPFLRDLLSRTGFAEDPDDVSLPDAEEHDSDSGSVFSTRSIDESEITDVYGVPVGGHGNEVPRGARVQDGESEVGNPHSTARTPFANVSTSEGANGVADAPSAPKSPRK